MPPKSSPAALAVLEKIAADHELSLRTHAPAHGAQLLSELDRKLALDVVVTRIPLASEASSTPLQALEKTITQEEHRVILEKLQKLLTLPQQQSEDTRLYLEQQLADILGFPIATEVRGFRLPHTVATLQKQAPWRTDPQTPNPQGVQSLSSLKPRSFYGSFRGSQLTSSQALEIATYGISLPLHLTEKWQQDPFVTSNWFRYKQVLLVNPVESVAVVCALADVYSDPVVRYQGAAAPAVICEGLVWSQTTHGTVLLYFVDTPQRVPFGIRSLAWKEQTHS
jgi:hypothetical protein